MLRVPLRSSGPLKGLLDFTFSFLEHRFGLTRVSNSKLVDYVSGLEKITGPIIGGGSTIKALDGEDCWRKRNKRKPREEFDPRGRGRERYRKMKNEFDTVSEFSVY